MKLPSTIDTRFSFFTAAAILLVWCGSANAQNPQVQGGSSAPSISAPARAVLVDVEDVQQENERAAGRVEMTLDQQQLDRLLFSNSQEQHRHHYHMLLKSEIEQIDGACGLTAEQKQMLEVAGAGELQNINEIAHYLRALHVGQTYDQNELNAVYQSIRLWQAKLKRKPLDPNSLVYKVLLSTLDEQQTAHLAKWTAERRRIQLRHQITTAVTTLEVKVPLRSAQRHALIQLLEEKIQSTHQARGLDQGTGAAEILATLHAIPMEAFATILEEGQLEALQAAFPLLEGNWAPFPVRAAQPLDVQLLFDAAPRKLPPAVAADVLEALNEQRKLLLEKAQER
jgi:hypothetical protein